IVGLVVLLRRSCGLRADLLDLRRALAHVDLHLARDGPDRPVEVADVADRPVVAVVRVPTIVEAPTLPRIPVEPSSSRNPLQRVARQAQAPADLIDLLRTILVRVRVDDD